MAFWNSPVRSRQSASSSARFRSDGWARWRALELGGRFGDLKGFVVGQRQIERRRGATSGGATLKAARYCSMASW